LGHARADSTGVQRHRSVRALIPRTPITVFSLVVMAFGLLLWARLVLVTGHPRVATAEPRPAAPTEAAERASDASGRVPAKAEGEPAGAGETPR
jgi:hypothetical protein